MENLIFVLGPFVFLVLVLAAIGGAIHAIVSRRHRDDGTHAPDPGIGTLRRLYFYAVSFVSLIMSTVGVVLIARFVLQELTETTFGGRQTGWLATGISLAIVGIPIWLVHWRLVQRQVIELPVERRSLVRKIYLYLVLAVALGVSLAAGIRFLAWAFRSHEFSPYSLAALTVWSAVWLYHWQTEGAEGHPTDDTRAVRRLYLYIASLATVSAMAVGAGRVMYLILIEGYEAASGLPMLLPSGTGLWRPELRDGVAVTLVTGGAWAAHWIWFAAGDSRSVLRQLYIYLFSSFGGAVTMLIGLGVGLYTVFEWSVSAQGSVTAAHHFRVLPGALTTFMVGYGLWAYHRDVARNESARDVHGIGRIYDYLLVAGGVAMAAAGAVAVVNLLLSAIADLGKDLISDSHLRGRQIALLVTLGLLAVPILTYNWKAVQGRAGQSIDEQTSSVRRAFLTVILGAGLLVALGGISSLVFIFLRDLLDSELALDTLRDSKTALGIMAAASVGLPYFWMVYRADRAAEPEEEQEVARHARKSVTVLTGDGGDAFVLRLEEVLGYPVSAVQWADDDARPPKVDATDFEDLARRVGESPGENVFMFPYGAQVRLLSYG